MKYFKLMMRLLVVSVVSVSLLSTAALAYYPSPTTLKSGAQPAKAAATASGKTTLKSTTTTTASPSTQTTTAAPK